MEYLLAPSFKTFEHIKARSTGGEDKAQNGILMCKQCNNARSSIPYTEFIEYHPYMPYHTQKQILQISDAILKGRVESTSKKWPLQVATTLSENSEGKLSPDVTSSYKKTSRKIKNKKIFPSSTYLIIAIKSSRITFVATAVEAPLAS